VLQQQEFERVGGTETHHIDVRILAATNRNLEELLRAGRFREDLFYRLNVVMIEIPSLRSRRDDIPPLLEHALAHYSRDQQRTNIAFSREAWSLLIRYDYPGNVRELENIVQRAVILSRGDTITTEELPLVVRGLPEEPASHADGEAESLPARVEKLEQGLVFEALRIAGGNQSRAAKQLGISERNLRYRLSKWKAG
jgi:DNA-binding NtrC family response regulator